MDKLIPIIKNNTTLTPYKFYTEFLQDLANHYTISSNAAHFSLFEEGDNNIHNTDYRIDPITIPLLLSLFEQLSKFYKNKIFLELTNNRATIEVLEFLYRSDFFYISGENKNPNYPKGRNITNFNEKYLGGFKGKQQRNEHRVRAYSLDDDNLFFDIKNYKSEEEQRDYLISHYTYKVREHFEDLLFDNEFTSNFHNLFIDILSELITNGVLHSKSNTFALMFVNRFKTKFSISDNGIGLVESIKAKKPTNFYSPQSLAEKLAEQKELPNISGRILKNLFCIFEALYYSSLRDRRGIFDLMTNVVLNSKGYFRLHTDNCQIIISNSMKDELIKLEEKRKLIYKTHNSFLLGLINFDKFNTLMCNHSKEMKIIFLEFYNKAVKKYNSDIKYSSLRFYKVRFRGVHIEVEIPNA